MDVITNALEGQVRQYFQGLPTASSSTASPTYQQPTQATSQSNHERPTVPYWPPHPDSRPKDVISEANPSHQSDPPIKNNQQSYYNPNYVEHYREYQQSSHILPNPSYQQRVAPTQRVQEPSYHQMQTPTSYYQNHRSYYKPVTSNNVKTVVTSQSQNQYDGFKYQSGMANNYGGNKNVKSTHNLPPIAGLQSNYAGFKTKKVTQAVPRSSSEVIFRNSNYHSSSGYQQHYSQSSNQNQLQQNQLQQNHQQNQQQNVQNVQNQNQQSQNGQQNQLQSQQLSHLVNQQQSQMQNRQQNQIESQIQSRPQNQIESQMQNLQQQQSRQQNQIENQMQSHQHNQMQNHQHNQMQNHQQNQMQNHQQNQIQNHQQSQIQNHQQSQIQNQIQNHQQSQIQNHQHNQLQNQQHNQQHNQQQNQIQKHQQNHIQNHQQNQIQNHQQNQIQNHQQNQIQNQIQNQQQNQLQSHHQHNQHQNQLQNQIHNQQSNQIHNQQSNQIQNHQHNQQSNHLMNHSQQNHQLGHQNNSNYQSTSIKAEFSASQNNTFDSVLDLSLKTIKTPADSTLDDNNISSDERNQPKYAPMRRYDQRGNVVRGGSVTSAPKVDFTPNFNRPLTHSQPISYNNSNNNNNNQERRNYAYYNQNQNNLGASRYYSPIRKETLPRIDFPSSNQIQKSQGMYVHQNQNQNQNLNQDQRKRLSSESMPVIPKKPKVDEKWRQAIDKQIEQKFSMYQKSSSTEKKSSMINGNLTYQTNQFQQRQYQMHQTYVPSPGVPQYPAYQQNLPRSNSQSSLNRFTGGQNVQGADKRVISILRSNLEMKGAKEAQRRQDQKVFNNSNQIQQPSTDVLVPKTAISSRQNVSPFTASSIERNTPPISAYKFPKAVDSIRFDLDEKPGCSQNDLDGLAANLAARIRTKGELKQMQQINQLTQMNQGLIKTELIKIEEPPKLTKEKLLCPPRRRVFNRDDEQSDKVGKIPPRDRTGMRSSSETSVFDFPDSDSETEMPVLERQSLEDMRRDRKITSKSILDEEKSQGERSLSPLDETFDKACDNFMAQLKTGGGKKRGRRKKIDTQIIAKLQENNKNINNNINNNNEEIVKMTSVIKEEKVEIEENKNELNQIKKELSDCSDSEDESESAEAKERKKRMEEQIKKSQQLYALRNLTSCLIKPPKKPTFGDGSDFYPGWEEELYRFKKSLRIPDNLIHVTRPPNCQRLSTSLPDLDPCPSPSNSSIIDEYKLIKKKEHYDSDIDSNCSFNFSMSKHYDSEEGSSVKSLNIKSRDSILDKLVERYSVKQKRRFKKKEETPKIIPKPENPLELLPTPSLDVENLTEKQKSGDIIKSDSAFLGFRKKTVENFKDTFINTSNIVGVGEQFTPVVLKSRTRKETRVLKQKATIREVFGEDRPASAPPVTCVDDLLNIKRNLDEKSDSISPKEVLKNKLLNKGKKLNLINVPNCGKIDLDAKSETPSLDGDENISKIIKKSKFRNIRRKGSSGFDYIRKKKKQVKKEDETGTTKQKRFIVKANPESVQDIQKEIKMWVLNKGIGETHLHRSARLGYTDITAYCLEKMECSPSPKDNAGYTPLHEACSRGHLSTAKLLLMYGANVSESAQGGIRPLHEAIENGFVEIVRLLLSYGADPTLATYAGVTPLSLASDEYTRNLLENHLKEIRGEKSEKWFFNGPSKSFDPEESGYDPLEDPPQQDSQLTQNQDDLDLDLDDFDFEVSDVLLPNLYSFINDSTGDRWILLQDLSNLLKIKSRDALLKQINPSGLAVGGAKSVLKELKMSEFLEQVRCCQFLNAGEKINPRASKIALIKYTDKVKELLNVEQVTIPAR